MNKKQDELKGWLIYVAAVILIGIALGVFVSLVTTNSAKKNATQQMTDVTKYIKKQCIQYEELQSEEVTRSLFDVSEKAFAIRSRTDYSADDVNVQIQSLAEENRLNGVIVTSVNDDGWQIIGSYFEYDDTSEMWTEYIDTFGSVATDLNKCYDERLTVNGYYYDYSIVARKDCGGVVLCYRRQTIKSVNEERYSIAVLLKGYVFGSNGAVVVTDGDIVLASNIDDIVGEKAAEVPVVRKLRQYDSEDSLINVEDEDDCYGVRSRIKDMFIYVYLPSSEVFFERTTILSYTFTFYLLAACAIAILRQTILYKKRVEQEEIDEAYRIEKEKLAQKAIRANEAKTDFLRRMSHDIRTPINGIRGMIKIADYYSDDLDKQRECREKIWTASDYLLDLVNDLLDLNKLTTDENLNWKDERFRMTELFDEVVAFTAPQAKEAGLTFVSQVNNIRHDYLFGGKVQLKRVFSNLITNAIKYNNAGGKVSVSCTETGFADGKAFFRFVCSDTGIGMSPEFIKKMYEPFERENSNDGNKLEGVGLGLAIVNKIVTNAGWTINVDSRKDKGTTFTVDIFVKTAEKWSKNSENSTLSDQSKKLQGYNILVAEDNDLNYEIVEFMLKVAGAKVTRANDGKHVVDLFENSPEDGYDVILMDVMMPNVDGLTATKLIRESQREDAKTIPIIAMTASAYADDVENARKAGMNAYIAKPIDNDKLMSSILHLAKRHRGGVDRQ